MIFSDILEELEMMAPSHYALSKDNCGFQVGRMNKDVNKVCLAVDVTDAVARQAVESEADLLITHHPLIFAPLPKITDDSIEGRIIRELILADINFFALHTNYDVKIMAELSAEMYGLLGAQVFDVTVEESKKEEGIGRYGYLANKTPLRECAEKVKSIFNLESVIVYDPEEGKGEKLISSVAISPGSGTTAAQLAIKMGVDLLITGDMKHHNALLAMAHGIAVIDAGHYGLEKIFVPDLIKFFKRRLPEVEVFAAKETNPFYVM